MQSDAGAASASTASPCAGTFRNLFAVPPFAAAPTSLLNR
jgi:hypothetical protein